MRTRLLSPAGLAERLRRVAQQWLLGDAIVDGTIDPAKMATPGGAHFLRTEPTSPFAVEWNVCSTRRIMLRNGSTDDIVGGTPALAWDILGDALVGTSFPSTNLYDGRPFVRSDHGLTLYLRDEGNSGWISAATYSRPFGTPVDIAATNYIGTGPGNSSADVQFSSTVGWRFGFPVRVVGMSVQMAASGTCTLQVMDDGSSVSGASLSPSSVAFDTDETLDAGTIAADSAIAVQVTSGTIEGPAFGQVQFRRFET